MSRNICLVWLTGLFLCTLLVACAAQSGITTIELKRYAPAFKADLSEYKGKHIYLMNFSNRANDTSVWYYYSQDWQFRYGSDEVIRNYFWYSFERALVSIGIIVSNWEGQDPTAQAVSVTLRSITDAKFEIQVKMEKSFGVFFIKNYEIIGDALNPSERTPENLEKRAYRMTNRLVETVLTDPEFKNAFLRTTAEMAKPRGH